MPESHECEELATPRVPFSAPLTRKSTLTSNYPCPKCGNDEKYVFDYDVKTITFKCHQCGHKWTLMKSTLQPVPSSEMEDYEKPKEKGWSFSAPSEAEIDRRRRVKKLLEEGTDIDKNQALEPIEENAPPEKSEEPPKGSYRDYREPRRSFPIRKLIIGIALGTVLVIAFLWYSPSLTILRNNPFLYYNSSSPNSSSSTSNSSNSNSTSANNSSSPNYSHEELLDYLLRLINSNRNGIVTCPNGTMAMWVLKIGEHYPQNVSLSSVSSAQQHAEDMLRNHYFSHWDTNDYKPYMRYTLCGGNGSVAENIAWQHSNGPFNIKEGIENLEWSMMEEDSEWNWGHRDNILDASHNRVSIGIAYDSSNLYLVEDFEDVYVTWSSFTNSGTQVVMNGTISKSDFLISHVAIYYDGISNLTTQQLATAPYNGSYDMGTFVGMALPSGWVSPEGTTITAETWSQIGTDFQIDFDFSPAFAQYGKGVYTLYLTTKSSDFLTSFSIWD